MTNSSITNASQIEVQAERTYQVRVGREILGLLPELLAGASRVAIVVPETLTVHARQKVSDACDTLGDAGYETHVLPVPDGEQAKTVAVLERCWELLGSWSLTRNDAIVGLGGGTATDLAGFLAATWLRGVRYVQVPTTLLAMVDASVGGKTGINTASGKNLVGAFYSPVGVLCDLTFLDSLPVIDLQSGMAEVVKVGLTCDPHIISLLQSNGAAATDPTSPVLRELIERAIAVKAAVVGDDFLEIASSVAPGELGREVLNYGHTLGHAIERVEHYTWRHGAAISVGMVFAAELAHAGGFLDQAGVAVHRELLGALELPLSYPGDRWAPLLEAMQRDKKTRGSSLRFVVLHGLGNPQPWRDPDPESLRDAYSAISR